MVYITLAGTTSVWLASVCTRAHLVLGSWELEVTMSSWDPSFFNPSGHVLDISRGGSSSATGSSGTCLSSLVGLLVPFFVSWLVCESKFPSEFNLSTFTLKSFIICFNEAPLDATFVPVFLIFGGFGPSSLSSVSHVMLRFFPSFWRRVWWCFNSSNALFHALDRFI